MCNTEYYHKNRLTCRLCILKTNDIGPRGLIVKETFPEQNQGRRPVITNIAMAFGIVGHVQNFYINSRLETLAKEKN